MTTTLPLPPPSRPDVTPPDSAGYTTVRGVVPSQTTAMVENLASGTLVGQHTDASGRYELMIGAQVGDVLVVYYRDGTENSDFVEVEVPEAAPSVGAAGAPSE